MMSEGGGGGAESDMEDKEVWLRDEKGGVKNGKRTGADCEEKGYMLTERMLM